MQIDLWEILRDKKYKFQDGESAVKRLVVISCAPNGPYLLVPTTSNIRELPQEGCNRSQNKNFGNFFVKKGRIFQLDTLIQSLRIKEVSLDELIKTVAVEKRIEKIGSLSKNIAQQIVACYFLLKEDVEEKYFSRIGSKN